jgi:hypothetical protein
MALAWPVDVFQHLLNRGRGAQHLFPSEGGEALRTAELFVIIEIKLFEHLSEGRFFGLYIRPT